MSKQYNSRFHQSSKRQDTQTTNLLKTRPFQAPIMPIQTKLALGTPNDKHEQEADLESAINRKRGSGQTLDEGLQRSMGQAMGVDFSRVRVHTDKQSDQLNQSIQAKAFTTGHDMFFRQGAYEPKSRAGQGLIAHELTHVVQQTQGRIQPKMQCQSNTLDGIVVQRAGDFTGLMLPHEKQRGADSYALGGKTQERDGAGQHKLTYHHIIPEGKLVRLGEMVMRFEYLYGEQNNYTDRLNQLKGELKNLDDERVRHITAIQKGEEADQKIKGVITREGQAVANQKASERGWDVLVKAGKDDSENIDNI